MKKLIIFLLFSSILNEFSIAQEPIYKNLTCAESYELIQEYKDDTNFVIIDLRPKIMYNAKHIANSVCAECISDNIDDYLKSLDKEKIYLIYCSIGKRSATAFEKMKELDFNMIYHLYQGLKEWNKQGFEVVSTEK